MKFIAENKKLAVVLGSIIAVLCIAGVIAVVCISHAKNSEYAGSDIADAADDSEDDFRESADDEDDASADDSAFEDKGATTMTPEELQAMAKEVEENFNKLMGSSDDDTAKDFSSEKMPSNVPDDMSDDFLPDDKLQLSAEAPINHTNLSYEEHIVLFDTDSFEEAEEIAEKLSGTLVSWKKGTAEIEIAETVDAVLQANHNPALYRKYIFTE